MSFLKINNIDFSMYVNELSISKKTNYNSQTNASGNMVVDLINSKREIDVGIIPLEDKVMINLLRELDKFSVKLTFLNPHTNALEENITCIVPDTNIQYYTIQNNKVSFKAIKIKFIEL